MARSIAGIVDSIPVLNDREFAKISQLAYEHSGLDLRAGKQGLVAARLGTKRLMAIWNALPGKKKMTKVVDRAGTIERLWAELQALPGGAAYTKSAKEIPARETKQSAVIALLQRPEGATIDEIAATTGWQRHTVRGAIAGALKKRLGLLVAAAKEERGRVYRIGQDGLAA